MIVRFGEWAWRALMSSSKYKGLFQQRSLPIVKSMYRLVKDAELKRAKARVKMTARARADTKAKARVSEKV